MPVQAKICGLSTPETINAALKGGASHIGFNFFPPSPRSVGFERARELAARVPGHVRKVGIFVDPCNALLDQAVDAGQLDVIQLHNTTPGRAAAIRNYTKRECWGAIGVRTTRDMESALTYRDAVEFLLYDAGQPEDAALRRSPR